MKLTDRPTYMRPTRLARARRWWWRKVRSWPGETCQRCGSAYGRGPDGDVSFIWFATIPTWTRVIGPHEGGRYCLPCFIRGCNLVSNEMPHITISFTKFFEESHNV